MRDSQAISSDGDGVLVLPVGGHAVLGPVVHRPGADLHLQRLARRSHHRRVQRLVEVELGHGDVVLEPALHRPPGGVDRAEGRVAVPDRVHQHADADQVEDVLEGPALHHHLLVDRPQVLGTAGDLSLDPQLGQAGLPRRPAPAPGRCRARGPAAAPSGRSRRSGGAPARRRRGPPVAALRSCIPRRWASGAYTSRVSRAM